MPSAKVLTVILNYETPDMTLKALEGAVREMEGIDGEIVVVDNGSGDGSFEALSEAIEREGWGQNDRVLLRQTGHNGGFGAGNNFAMRQGLSDGTQPDFCYLLNSDAVPKSGAIRNLLSFMRNTPDAGVAGSSIIGIDGVPHQTAFRFPSLTGEFEGAVRTGIFSRLFRNSIVALPLPTETCRVDWVAGASVMLRRRMLDEIGLFDETFFLYFEETDLCHRAARAGWKTYYVCSSQVSHVGSFSTGMKLWRRTPQYWFDSRLHYFTKTYGRGYAFGATLARVAGGALWRLRVAISSKPLGDPPHFLRDLIVHFFRHAFGRTQPWPETRPVREK